MVVMSLKICLIQVYHISGLDTHLVDWLALLLCVTNIMAAVYVPSSTSSCQVRNNLHKHTALKNWNM